MSSPLVMFIFLRLCMQPIVKRGSLRLCLFVRRKKRVFCMYTYVIFSGIKMQPLKGFKFYINDVWPDVAPSKRKTFVIYDFPVNSTLAESHLRFKKPSKLNNYYSWTGAYHFIFINHLVWFLLNIDWYIKTENPLWIIITVCPCLFTKVNVNLWNFTSGK